MNRPYSCTIPMIHPQMALETKPAISRVHGSVHGTTRTNNFSWKIAGEAGDGILNAGLMLARTCMRGGLYVFAAAEYPSLIRGGHNHLDVRVSDKPVDSHTKWIDLLVALNMESVEKHAKKILPGGGIIYDGDALKLTKEQIGRDDVQLYPLPLMKLAMAHGGKIMRNVVAMGASLALADFDLELFNGVLRDNFGKKKGAEIAEQNIRAAKAGYDAIRASEASFPVKLRSQPNGQQIFLSGNEAISAGAIKAGCTFFAAYPMTPASSILHTMAAFERPFNLVVKHTEDEISAINMAVGASYAGARAMTSTSGGGFSLMVEGFGLAAQTETPLVVVEAMRPGPATGMATHSGQGDLRFVLHASTDEFPRMVVAPGDFQECYIETIRAFNLAEKYQMPVVVLTDKYLGESYSSTPIFGAGDPITRNLATEPQTNGYMRYTVTEDGISPRTIPGVSGGTHVASSYEHDEEGHECEEPDVRIAMHQKRYRKFMHLADELPQPQLVGPADAELTFVTWGSPKGPILEARKLLEADGIKTSMLQIKFLSPFPAETVKQILSRAKHPVLVENNMTAQLGSLIREECLFEIKDKILRYDGRPFYPEDIVPETRRLLGR